MTDFIKSTMAVLSALFLSACSDFKFAVANAPSSLFDGSITHNIVFDRKTDLALDIYRPDENDGVKHPVIVFFYGGRWQEGIKEDYAFVGTALAAKGYVVVIPDYRKYPEVRFPAFVEDGAKALKWVSENVENYGGSSDTIFLSGHSSGAHIASLLTADESYLAPPIYKNLKGFAGLSGPYAFTPQAEDLKDIFGPSEKYPSMRTTTFIDGKEPPMLLIYGGKDKAVARFNLERLENAIEKKNGDVKTIIYEDLNHAETVGAFTVFWRNKAPVLDDVDTFFKALLEN